ncbi:NAD/FAD-dependent oxidoreductase [cyanobiont of Ornithocercus magnificus]|nr:NAD/FAD-dependent oxidoreductase [cyanobiont of Ornithocercus magnificus]
MNQVNLAVVGAGLSGCALISSLRRIGYAGLIAVVEAGRGPGGRTASRQRRGDASWCLDHGAPNINLTTKSSQGLRAILDPLRNQGILRSEWDKIIGLNEYGSLVDPGNSGYLIGEILRAYPAMSSLCESLISEAKPSVLCIFGKRVRSLRFVDDLWKLIDEQNNCFLTARQLVLSGMLLAHPRSLVMLNWKEVPLRTAIPVGKDRQLDQALKLLEKVDASVRWNLMMELPNIDKKTSLSKLPRQLILTTNAQNLWSIERLIIHKQVDGRVGLVVHGLNSGDTITPDSQPGLLKKYEHHLMTVLPQLLKELPTLGACLKKSQSLGVMRWGASQPLNYPLPATLQWCKASRVGFCGDWIEGPGFGRAEGALISGVNLAEHLIAHKELE